MCLIPLLSGCATSSSNVAIAPKLPDIPAALSSECADPGVKAISTVGEAATVIGENRVYAACNKRKQRDLKNFYRGVQKEFEGSTPQ